jgi:hypothetical protein
MSAAWMHMLDQICPGYEELKDAIGRGPTVTTKVVRKGKKWLLTLNEQWPFSHTRPLDAIILDDVVTWSEKILEKWPTCKRLSWDSWEFKSKRDAEKFQTIFYLSWDKLNIR